jgi:hypothetical protein
LTSPKPRTAALQRHRNHHALHPASHHSAKQSVTAAQPVRTKLLIRLLTKVGDSRDFDNRGTTERLVPSAGKYAI